jgi:drug/metabolite transporter (DMT)-like permease
MRKEILALIFVNIIWGLIPLPAARLLAQYSSFLIIFIRLLVGGIVLGLFTIGSAIIINFRNKKANLPFRLSFFKLGQYLRAKNPEFYRLPQWSYIFIVAFFGINIQLVFFFLGLKLIGAVVTSIGYLVGLLLTAVFNWARGREDITGFKALYLGTLVVALIILGIVSAQQDLPPGMGMWEHFMNQGMILAVIYGVFLGFFFISGDADQMIAREFNYIRQAPYYSTMRTFAKLSLLFLVAAITMLPLLLILKAIPLAAEIGNEVDLFFHQFNQIGAIILLPDSLALIFLCTVLPFLVYYILAALWPKNSSFNLWAGVLSILEPIMNILIGVTVLNERFPVPWFLVITLLLFIGILIRYLSESQSQVQAVIFLKVAFGNTRVAMIESYKCKNVRRVTDLLGEYDFMLDVLASSQTEFSEILEKTIRRLPGLLAFDVMFISKIEEDRGTPESFKGMSLARRVQL